MASLPGSLHLSPSTIGIVYDAGVAHLCRGAGFTQMGLPSASVVVWSSENVVALTGIEPVFKP